MRKSAVIISVFLSLFLIDIAFPRPVDQNTVRGVATRFLTSRTKSPTTSLEKKNLKIGKIEAVMDLDNNDEILAYVANVHPRGFLLLSSDTNLEPVVAYSFRFNWQSSEKNILWQIFERDLRTQKQTIQSVARDVRTKNILKWSQLLETDGAASAIATSFQQWPEQGTTSTGGWMETTWHQLSPFNNLCPMDPDSENRNLVGCVAAAMAQIVNYHQNTGNLRLSENDRYTTSLHTIQIDADSTKLDFPSFQKLNTILEQIDFKYQNNIQLSDSEKAALNFTCAIILQTNFDYPNSGVKMVNAAESYVDKFGYFNAELLFPDSTFYHILKENMINGFPAQLSINKSDASATSLHSVVADGYNTDGFYHLNFGWGKNNPDEITDAWYFIPEHMGAGYNFTSSSIANIKPTEFPKPHVVASNNSLNVPACRVGENSEMINFSLINQGKAIAEIDYIISDKYFLISTTMNNFNDSLSSTRLQPGEQLNLYVQCRPDSIGVFKGDIIVSSSSGKEYLMIHLVGHGIPADGTNISRPHVSGTWDKAGSPYYICNDITVPKWNRLEIAPGTEIIFIEPYRFDIGADAQLTAKGTDADSIYFHSCNPEKGWLGINFQNSGIDDTLSFCVITNGQADGRGGAISISSSSPFITHSKISHNHASYGGAISFYKSFAKISHLKLVDNSADFGGGALYLDDSSPTISNSIIFNNKANYGGAICGSQSSPFLRNVTITQNEALSCGGALYLSGYNFFNFKNSILWANKADSGATLSFRHTYPKPDSIVFNYSNIDTSTSNWIIKGPESYRYKKIVRWFGHICEAPLFKNPEQENFYLQLNSPCIDAGDPSDDFGVEPFPHGYCINMGAYGGTPKAAITNFTSLAIVPNVLDFGIIEANDITEKTCYLKNGSPGPIHINDIALSDTINFVISRFSPNKDTTNLNLTLKPGEIDSVKVLFLPSQNIEQEYIADILVKMDECPSKKIKLRGRTFEQEEEQHWEPVPRKPQLSQNYPNPFNTETVIEYRMHRDDEVALKIYNTLGKEIRTIETKLAKAGLNRVIWDGKDNEGKTVASGLYFYQLRTGYYRRFKKMMLIY
jgi:hypothetical protein